MTAMKKKKTAEVTGELVAGRFRPDSFKAKIYMVLADGKPHQREELDRCAKGCADISGRIAMMKKNGIDVVRAEDGAYRLASKPKPKKETK